MRRRAGFTITELLVAMALIMFVMAVLSEAFVAGLESFRQLKSVGDMDQRLRTAMTVLRRDLDANWLQTGTKTNYKLSSLNSRQPTSGFFTIGGNAPGSATGSGFISHNALFNNLPTIQLSPPPNANLKKDMFFYIYPTDTGGNPSGDPIPATTASSYAGGPANPVVLASDPGGLDPAKSYRVQWDTPTGLYDYQFPEGPQAGIFASDADTLAAPFATAFKLYFSIDLSQIPPNNATYKPDRRENFVAAAAPAASPLVTPLRPPFQDPANYLTQAAEVAYFLVPNGATIPSPPSSTAALQPGMQQNWNGSLYSLYRRQLALLKDQDAVTMNAANVASALTSTVWSQNYFDFSGVPVGPKMQFNTLKTVSSPHNRCLTYSAFNPGPFVPNTPGADWFAPFPRLGPSGTGRGEPSRVWGADLLLTDVISFTVRMLPNPIPNPAANPDPYLYPGTPYKDSFGNIYYLPGAFDTYFMSGFDSHNVDPSATFKVPSVQALEITIRVWDQKTQRTRQITVVQAM